MHSMLLCPNSEDVGEGRKAASALQHPACSFVNRKPVSTVGQKSEVCKGAWGQEEPYFLTPALSCCGLLISEFRVFPSGRGLLPPSLALCHRLRKSRSSWLEGAGPREVVAGKLPGAVTSCTLPPNISEPSGAGDRLCPGNAQYIII